MLSKAGLSPSCMLPSLGVAGLLSSLVYMDYTIIIARIRVLLGIREEYVPCASFMLRTICFTMDIDISGD